VLLGLQEALSEVLLLEMFVLTVRGLGIQLIAASLFSFALTARSLGILLMVVLVFTKSY
jgi:hypothetical protein